MPDFDRLKRTGPARKLFMVPAWAGNVYVAADEVWRTATWIGAGTTAYSARSASLASHNRLVTARFPLGSVFDVLTGKWRGAGRLAGIYIRFVEVRHVNIRWDVEVGLAAWLLFLGAVFRPSGIRRLIARWSVDDLCQVLLSLS
jgi:hypothetical protein